MSGDINRLHIELDYGEVVNFNERYFVLSTIEENFKKNNNLLVGSYIALPVFLIKYHNINIDSSEEFLKFKLINKPKKIIDFFESQKISKFLDLQNYIKLDNSEKLIISIFKKLNILPFPIFLKKKPQNLKFSFNFNF